jgi:hypothetical protein
MQRAAISASNAKGAAVKPYRLLWAVIFVGLVAFAAKADGLDPKIIINVNGSDAEATTGTLTETYTPSGFSVNEVDNTASLNGIDLTLDDVPDALGAAAFSCGTNVFDECNVTVVSPLGSDPPAGTEDLLITFDDYADNSGGCVGVVADASTCTGVIPEGEGFTVSLTATPEPSTIALLLCGLVPLFLIGRKRWTNASAA